MNERTREQWWSRQTGDRRFRKQALWVILPLAVVELAVIVAIVVKIAD